MIYTLSLNPALDKTLIINDLIYEEVNLVQEVYLDAAGKGINVSKAIKNLGGKSIALGFLGGQTGELIKELLKKDSINHKFITIPGETRTNLTIFDSSTKKTIKINEKGPLITPVEIKLLFDQLAQLYPKPSYFIISGSLPPGVSSNIYQEIVTFFQKQRVKVILDSDKEALKDGVKSAPFLIKPNLSELNRLTGVKASSWKEIVKSVQGILKLGVKIIVVTLGEKGALLISKDLFLKVTPPKVPVRGTIGVGDAFLAGLVLKLSRRSSLEEALKFACACGSASVSLSGTQVCTKNEAEALLKKIKLEKLPQLNFLFLFLLPAFLLSI